MKSVSNTKKKNTERLSIHKSLNEDEVMRLFDV